MYYNALYANDPYNRVIALKLMYVEPFVHSDTSEVVTWNIDKELMYQKLTYNEWVSSIEKDSIIDKKITELQAELSAFVQTKYQSKFQENETEKVQ